MSQRFNVKYYGPLNLNLILKHRNVLSLKSLVNSNGRNYVPKIQHPILWTAMYIK